MQVGLCPPEGHVIASSAAWRCKRGGRGERGAPAAGCFAAGACQYLCFLATAICQQALQQAAVPAYSRAPQPHTLTCRTHPTVGNAGYDDYRRRTVMYLTPLSRLTPNFTPPSCRPRSAGGCSSRPRHVPCSPWRGVGQQGWSRHSMRCVCVCMCVSVHLRVLGFSDRVPCSSAW